VRLGFHKHHLDIDAIQKKAISIRVFRCWRESWETELIGKKDVVVQNKFLKKYGGLRFFDADQGLVVTISSTEMFFNAMRGKNRGWVVYGLKPSYNKEYDDPKDYDTWVINHHLFGNIFEYYQKNRTPGIFCETQPASFHSDGKWWFCPQDPLENAELEDINTGLVDRAASKSKSKSKSTSQKKRNGRPKRG
jgi:hypothetical protein